MKSKRGQQAIEAGGDTVTEDVTTEQTTAELPAAPAPVLPKPVASDEVSTVEDHEPALAGADEASVIEPDLQVIVGPESPIASVTKLPVAPVPTIPGKDRISSLLERLERLERGLAAVGDRLDRIAPPDVRLVEAHDDPSRMSPWTDRHSAAAALPRDGGSAPYRVVADISEPQGPVEPAEPEEAAVSGADGPDYLPDEVFIRLQKTVADRLRHAKQRD